MIFKLKGYYNREEAEIEKGVRYVCNAYHSHYLICIVYLKCHKKVKEDGIWGIKINGAHASTDFALCQPNNRDSKNRRRIRLNKINDFCKEYNMEINKK